MSKQDQTTTQKVDLLAAQLIYGVVIQVIIFYICSIWLTYLPATPLYFLHHTYLFSLYLAYKLPTLYENKEDLSIIIQRIKKLVENFTKLLPWNNEINSIKYLAIVAALFHMPALFGITLTYIILSQNYGYEQVESLLNISLIVLCSLLSIASSILLPLAVILSPIIFTLMFSDASLLKSKEWAKYFTEAKDTFYEKFETGSATDKIVLFMIAISLLMPSIQAIPFICILYPRLSSPALILFKFMLSTLLVGERSHQFLSPAVESENIDHLFQYAKNNAIPAIFNYFVPRPGQAAPPSRTLNTK